MSELPNLNDISKTYDRGFLGNTAKPEARYIADRGQVVDYVDALKTLGQKIVLTSGTFDLVHVGHARYLEKAKTFGDILVVGVDSDRKVRERKGPDRPIVPDQERVQMLAHLRSVDLLTLKESDEAQWQLIKEVQPDTLVVTAETYSSSVISELGRICGEVMVLEPQATTSTSAQIRRLQVDFGSKITQPIDEILASNGVDPSIREQVQDALHFSAAAKRS